jgi:hypothetical protein
MTLEIQILGGNFHQDVADINRLIAHPFCNLQSRARTHAVLVIGLYELLGKPTTYLTEQPGPLLNIDNVMCVLVCNYNIGPGLFSEIGSWLT